jgi:DNA polymerase elongation subunit (family B)
VCWKWAGKKEVKSLNWGIKKQNSAKMIAAFTKEIEKADIVVAHNGDHFDVKHINTQRLLHG